MLNTHSKKPFQQNDENNKQNTIVKFSHKSYNSIKEAKNRLSPGLQLYFITKNEGMEELC
jgi:hypothetical protein